MLIRVGTLMNRLRGATALDQTPFAEPLLLSELGLLAISSASLADAALSELGLIIIESAGA
jgi:hypothetical protein